MANMNSETLLARLVAYDTTSTRSNLELIDFVRNWLGEHKINSRLIPSKDGGRANLYATIGPEDRGGIMLSGHTDVVPTTGQDWNSDPYQLKTTDDTLIGRGTCDMKGFIACTLAALPTMQQKPLQTPIHLAFSYDEEIGCVGARRLVDAMTGFEVKPRIGLIGEPTSMNAVLAHKGKLSFRVRIHGLSCHSAYVNNGVNSIEYAARLITFIRDMNAQMLERGQRDHSYTVPHSTFHVGNIQGGTALNIVPKSCEFEFEIRNLPQDDLEALAREIRDFADTELLPEMRNRYPQSAIDFEPISHYPGLRTDPSSAAMACTRAINPLVEIGDNVSFGTEAGLFDGIGINSLVCGPGSIDQAHKPDEFIGRDQLRQCDQMIANLVHRCQLELAE